MYIKLGYPSSQNVYGYNTPFWLKLVAPVQLCGSFAHPSRPAKEKGDRRTEPARENAPGTFVFMYIVINARGQTCNRLGINFGNCACMLAQ